MNQGPNEIYRSQTQNIPSLLSNIFRKRDNERWDRKWKGEWMMVPLIFVKLNAKSLIFLEFWACYLDFSSSLMGALKRKRFGEIGIWDFGETPRDEVPVTHDGVVWYVLSFSCYVMSHSFAKPWTVALQDPLFMAIPRQEYWSGLPFLFQGIFLTQGSNPCLLCWQVDFTSEPAGKPKWWVTRKIFQQECKKYTGTEAGQTDYMN